MHLLILVLHVRYVLYWLLTKANVGGLRRLFPVLLLHQVITHVLDITIILLGTLTLDGLDLDQHEQILFDYILPNFVAILLYVTPLLLAIVLDLEQVFLLNNKDGCLLAKALHRRLIGHVTNTVRIPKHDAALIVLADCHFKGLPQRLLLAEHFVVTLDHRRLLQQ